MPSYHGRCKRLVRAHRKFGFFLATGFVTLLHLGALINETMNTARAMIGKLDYSEYEHSQV